MAMQGKLSDMTVADLIQHNCQDRKLAQLTIDHNGEQAVLYFKNGQVLHAALGNLSGEEVIYRILAWEEGLFTLKNEVEAPRTSIKRTWSGLLLEGARRIDEAQVAFSSNQSKPTEVHSMATKLEEVLKGLAGEVNGYIASAVVGTDGIGIAEDLGNSKTDIEAANAQATLLIKLVDTSIAKLRGGNLEDNLLTTDNAYILTRFLEGKSYFLTILADRRNASLGNLRLMSRIYAERVSKAIPR
ncbi:MAG: DUF4388 domain-containing protein [Chloroflexota bacterium]